MKYGVCAPVGGYSNHLRWLLYLSKEFHLFGENKLTYIKLAVYNSRKTARNWIETEWKFRTILNKCIMLDHNIENIVVTDDPMKIVVMIARPRHALKSYLKFNPTLNGHTVRTFMRHVDDDNKSNTRFTSSNANTIVVDSSILYNPILDKELYTSIVAFLDIEDCYDNANEIHKIWYDLHVKAEKEVLLDNPTELVKSIYRSST